MIATHVLSCYSNRAGTSSCTSKNACLGRHAPLQKPSAPQWPKQCCSQISNYSVAMPACAGHGMFLSQYSCHLVFPHRRLCRFGLHASVGSHWQVCNDAQLPVHVLHTLRFVSAPKLSLSSPLSWLLPSLMSTSCESTDQLSGTLPVTPGCPEMWTALRPSSILRALAGGSLPLRPDTASLPASLDSIIAIIVLVVSPVSLSTLHATPRQLQ